MLKKWIKDSLLPAVIICGFLFITGFQSYQPKAPQFVGSQIEPFQQTGVHISAKRYSNQESKRYLDRNLYGVGLAPVQVTIQNNTDTTYFLSSEGLNLSTSSGHEVASAVTKTTIPRSIGFKVASLFFWPMVVPGTIDSILTFKNHLQMKKDYHAKSIKEEGEYLPPYTTANRVLFFSTGTHPDKFTLHMQKHPSGQFVSFQVKINS